MIEKYGPVGGIKNIDLSWVDSWLPNRLYNLSLRSYKVDNLLDKRFINYIIWGLKMI